MAQAQNNLPADITGTVDNILTELDAFSANVGTEYTLAGSVAVYLFVYSLYVNESDAKKKEYIKTQLTRLPKPNDIDIIIYTQGHLQKAQLSAYKKIKPINKNNTIPALNSIDGLPIQRRETPIFKIDLIVTKPIKRNGTSFPVTFKHNGIEKTFDIVHPQNLISLYKNDNNRTDNQKASNSIKRGVLEDLNKMKLLPEKEKPVSRYAAKSPSSETKRKRKSGNSSNLQSRSPSPLKTKKPSVKRRFNFDE
jgi:hypothetical protein